MLTRITVRNFKRFETISVDLGNPVVFIGPNNMGKTSALQALALWDAGVRAWRARFPDEGKGKQRIRYGATLNRKDLIAMPTPSAKLLWKNLRVRRATEKGKNPNILIEIIVDGIDEGVMWSCGLEFDYANAESIYCRPIQREDGTRTIPEQAKKHGIAYLPTMSGLAANEFVKRPGEVSVLIGEGQTAQVLRNLCYATYNSDDATRWNSVVNNIRELFGVELLPPNLNPARDELTLAFREVGAKGAELDISCAGRGLQQTLLLFVYMFAHPGNVLLLDEPDAHLEILRQREIFTRLVKTAQELGAQIVAASHSEVILDEGMAHGTVIAFVGNPHTLAEGKSSQARKALSSIGWSQYYQAEQTGWVLYLESRTDLDILQAFAHRLNHPAKQALVNPFIHSLGHNQPEGARFHFYALRDAYPDLRGMALFDRLDKQLNENTPLTEYMWKKREIENYLCQRETLLAFVTGEYDPNDMFGKSDAQQRQAAMEQCIQEIETARRTLGKPDPWSEDTKASDDFLDILFANYSAKIGAPLVLRKNGYHKLVPLVPEGMIDPEIPFVLDAIVEMWKAAGRDA